MSDVNMSLADALAPSSAPAPAPASAPAPAPEPAVPTPPQPPAAGNVNPYVPPATPPQNLQTPAPETPAPPSTPDQGQQPPAQTQGEQSQQPQIPQEYTQAHEWRGQIEREAEALGGLENVPMALKWSRMLFGLEQAPEGVAPAAHFLNELWRVDKQVYREVLGAVAGEHADRLLEHLEDRFFDKTGIPKDRLPEVQDFLRYGRVPATEAAHREFIGLLKPETQAIFARLKPAQQNFFVDQVDRGYMTLDFAEQEISEKGILLAIDSERAEAKQREAEAAKFEDDRRARQIANDEIGRYEKTFVEAQARKHGVSPEDIHEKVAFVAGTLDAAASADERHPAKVAWDGLIEAAGSGNPLRIQAAMNRMRIVFEAAFDDYMGKRGKAPAPTNGHQPPGQPQQTASLRQQQQPQFEPDNPNAGEDWSNVSLDDYLFGRAQAPAAR